MFREIGRTLNGIGDVSQSESEDEPEEISKPTVTASSVSSLSSSHPTHTSPPLATDDQGEAPKKKSKKKKKKKRPKASKPEVGDTLDMDGTMDTEELDLYDLSRSVEERIELAVTKFRKNRRFNPTRSQILSAYLDYGGIKSGQKAFQGGGTHGEDGGEPDYEILKAGIDLVEPKDDQVVDFTNVATTFLSEYFLYHTGWISHDYYVETPKVVASLLNYFLLRNVAPEFKDDIAQALEVAKQAGIELPIVRDVSRALPGMFSKSCSMLLEGSLHDIAHDEDPWQGASVAGNTYGTDLDLSRRVLQSLLGPDVDIDNLNVVSRGFMELEVIAVHIPEETISPGDKDNTTATGAATVSLKGQSGPIDIGEGEDLANNPKLESLLDRVLHDQEQQQQKQLQQQQEQKPEQPEQHQDANNDEAKESSISIDITAASTANETADDIVTVSVEADPEMKLEPVSLSSQVQGIENVIVPPADQWPIPVFARIEFAEWDSDLLREEQKPLSERRHLSTYLEVDISKKLLTGMRFDAKVFKLPVGDVCYLEQASLRPSYYLASDIVEAEDGEAHWAW
ncbi:hypothetical protein BGW42_004147 [Actinomortierella wolfii]|nr:hypothetical protein BGW42_004147 [Actinomortierella wolfii]